MSARFDKFMPWLGPDGRLSPLKLAIFIALFIPALWVAYQFDQRLLGPRPLNQAVHEIGLWAIRLFMLSLAVTPLRHILRWPELTLTRRMIGVAAFVYIVIHLILYTADEKFDLLKVVSEIYLRIYLTIGFAALVGLFALAVTSTDAMVARMGSKNWRRLHRLTFVIALLGSIHFFMQSKADVWEPMWMSGLFLWLLAYRLVAWRKKSRAGLSAPWLFGLAPAIALITAFGEALYYNLVNGVDPLLVLQANLGTMAGIRPSWIVLAVGLVMATLALVRGPAKRRAPVATTAARIATSETTGGP